MNNDRRRARHERHLGENPECEICGCKNTIVLERMEPAIFLRLARRERTRPRGGDDTDETACAFCGCTNAEILASIEPDTLVALVAKARGGQAIILCKTHCNVITGRGAIEDHHVGTSTNQPDVTIPLGGNHHAEETEKLRCAGVSMKRARTTNERLASALRAQAEFFSSLAQAHLLWADELLAESRPSPDSGEQK